MKDKFEEKDLDISDFDDLTDLDFGGKQFMDKT